MASQAVSSFGPYGVHEDEGKESVVGRLDGKVAAIVGASGGIGAATVRRFIREGAAVALVDLPSDALTEVIREAGRESGVASAVAAPADISRDDSVMEAFASIQEKFGQLDILVNSAAIRVPTGSINDVPMSSWQAILEVNLLGVVRCSKHALPLMTGGNGSIVHVSSTGALRGRPGWSAYDATKAALLALTRDMACDHVDQGTRVNAVCPGPTLTPYHLVEFAEQNRIGVAEAEARLLKGGASNLMNRPARPAEIANAVLFLASDEASFVTGSVLQVDGGVKPAESGFVSPQPASS